MIKIRLRHPKGVTSLDLDPESSIMALSEKIFSATEIPPINQEYYDAVSLAPMEGAPLDFHTTVFPVSNQAIYKGAETMASHLRQNKAFTNTATFTLKCEKCGVGLKGEKEARAHASSTGHAEFGEY
ncbi:ubiquitin-specific protease otu1 [Tulasnella sp. 331]|nr:ubiquitin-specific protease otu1 [Tulasnella sp. 331]KAG8889906.1 ubiquitin-specific protease otu1 [Tulasnella sp. 332]